MGEWWWWWGGNLGIIEYGCASKHSKATPFIYLAFEKTDPFIYFIVRNVVDLFIYICTLSLYCPFDFYTSLLLVVIQISQSIH